MIIANIRIPDSHYLGLDLARGLAILGMVFVNFIYITDTEKYGGVWFHGLFVFTRGRPSVLFVVLAGAGIALITHRARIEANEQLMRQHELPLLKRALFLFVLGLLLAPLWSSDILHFYGLYIAFLILLIRAPNGVLWGGTCAAQVGFLLLYLIFDFNEGTIPQTMAYPGFWTLNGMVRRLFFNGYYPFFPWIGFLMAGMWLGRQNLNDKKLLHRILMISVGSAVVGFAVVALLSRFSKEFLPKWFDYLSANPMPPGPLYVLTSGALAFATIALAQLLIMKKWAAKLFSPLIAIGKMALSVYVGHIIIGMTVLQIFGVLKWRSDEIATLCTVSFFIGSLLFAWLWRKKYERGPVEWLMHYITDRSEPR